MLARTGIILATQLAFLFSAACGGGSSVEIINENGHWRLLRNGEPYQVNGAGIDSADLESFAAHGGTSFRTWRTSNARQVLDEAQRLGLTVVMCLEIGRERHGFDYDDESAVAAQLEFARKEVLKYKDHPALLVWIGDETPAVLDSAPGTRVHLGVWANHP